MIETRRLKNVVVLFYSGILGWNSTSKLKKKKKEMGKGGSKEEV